MPTIYTREILDLAERYPYSIFEIDPLYWKCRTLYHPRQKAFTKCENIILTASEFAISLNEAMELQVVIDFELQ